MDENPVDERRILGVVDLRDLVFPVFAASKNGDGTVIAPVVYGTAFCVGPGIFATCAHVARTIEQDGGVVALGDLRTAGAVLMAPSRRVERFDAVDVALIACKLPAIAVLRWQDPSLGYLDDVSAFGFPYAVDVDEGPAQFRVSMRAFKGYIITRRTLKSLPGRPPGYEVSASFPAGLSGAPLLRADPGIPDLVLCGMVVGRGQTEVQGDTVAYGEALDVSVLAGLSSSMVGGTLDDLRRVERQQARSRAAREGGPKA
jgi:hypothetical protein